jgi:glycerophosphoryl diester phosphodiesterase
LEAGFFGLRDQGLVDRVAKEISAFGLQSQVLISSFNPLVVRRARRRFPPTVAVALIRGPGVYRHTRWTVDTGVENPHYSLVDEAYMDRAARLGRYTFAWTVDDVAEARRLVALGVNGIITNVPDQMQEQLAFP